jgi:hypothetical protein
MKCSKLRFASRLRVEDLESRLQPGSMITGSGYGWSLLADNLSVLGQESLQSQSLVSQTSEESGSAAQTTAPVDTHNDSLETAVVAATAARNESTAPAAPLGGPAAGLTTDLASLTGHANSVPLAAVAEPTVHPQMVPSTPAGSVAQSPVGLVTAPTAAAPVQNSSIVAPGPQPAMAPLAAPEKLDAQIAPVAPLQAGPTFQVTTQTSQNLEIRTGSAPAWASYLGDTGDDRINWVTLDPNIVAAQPVVVVGFSQNPADSTDTRGMVARFSTDGTQATVAFMDLGANTSVNFRGATVDPNDGAVYVAGQVTQNGLSADLVERVNPTLTGVDWALSHTPNISGISNSVKVDATGQNLYVTGGLDGATQVSQLTGLNNASPTILYDVGINFTAGPSVGNGVAPDSQGNADLAIQIQTQNAVPAQAQVNQTASALNWASGFSNSKGPNGSDNAIFVDSMDNVYITGGIGVSNPPLVDELISSFDSFGNQLNGVRISAQGGGQFQGFSIQTDAAGNVFTGITDAGTDLVGNMAFLEVDATFSSIVEYTGNAFGALDDQNRGLALDQTNGTLYLAGFTNSPDFNFTAGSFQSTFAGGPWDGVLIQYTVF